MTVLNPKFDSSSVVANVILLLLSASSAVFWEAEKSPLELRVEVGHLANGGHRAEGRHRVDGVGRAADNTGSTAGLMRWIESVS